MSSNPLFLRLRAAGRVLRHLAVGLALLILFEDMGLEPLYRALTRLGRLPTMPRIE